MSSTFRSMNNKQSRTPYIVAICSTIIACCLGGMLFFSKQNTEDYVTEEWVKDALANNYSSNMTDEQTKTIVKTVSSKVQTNMSDIMKDVDLASIMSQSDKEWLKRYIDDEITSVAGDMMLSSDKRSEITNEIIREVQSKTSDSSNSNNSSVISATEVQNLKRDVEALNSTKTQLEKALRDVEDASKLSATNEESARKKATEAADSAVKSLKETLDSKISSNTTTTSNLSSKISSIESTVNKLESSNTKQELQSSIDSLRRELNSSITAASNAATSATSNIKSLESQITAAQANVTAVQSGLTSAQSGLTSAQSDITALKNQQAAQTAGLAQTSSANGKNEIWWDESSKSYKKSDGNGGTSSGNLAKFVTEALNKESYSISAEPITNSPGNYRLVITKAASN